MANASSASGGTSRSTAMASKGQLPCASERRIKPGPAVSSSPRWPCSQRVRWLVRPSWLVGNWLVTVAAGQNSGGLPSRHSSRPSLMSSTRWPVARLAAVTSCQLNAMPAPINWHGKPARAHPRGRTRFFTRQANSATCTFSPAPAGACIRYRDCTGRPASMQQCAKRSTAPALTWQSASMISTTCGGLCARCRTP
ncbi:hypothetical protein D3C73_1157860 [compost metagenome]